MIMKAKDLTNTEFITFVYTLRVTKTTRDFLIEYYNSKSKQFSDVLFGMGLSLWLQTDITKEEFDRFKELIEGRDVV